MSTKNIACSPACGSADDLALEEAVGRGVERGHMHLHAGEHVVVTVATGGGGDRLHVRPRAFLGDRVALVTLAANRRQDPPFQLLGGHHSGRPCRWSVNAPPEGVRRAAELLGDEGLLEHRHPPAAQLLRHVHREQAELDRQPVMTLPGLLGDLTLVLLGVELPRDQLVVDEPASTILDRAVLVRRGVRSRGGGHRRNSSRS